MNIIQWTQNRQFHKNRLLKEVQRASYWGRQPLLPHNHEHSSSTFWMTIFTHQRERGTIWNFTTLLFCSHGFPCLPGHGTSAPAQRSTATTILASKPSPIYPASIVVNSSMPFQDILIQSTSTDLHKPFCNSLVHKTAPDRNGEHKKCIGGWKLAGYVIDEGEIPPSSVGKGQRTLNWRNAVLVGHENQMEECRCPKVSSSRSPPLKEDKSQFLFLEYPLSVSWKAENRCRRWGPDVWGWSVLFS